MAEPTTASTSTDAAGNGAPQKSRGLEGVTALDTELSFIDGQKGELLYRGYTIEDLAQNASFEETAYLLWKGELPTQSQLDDLNGQLREARQVHPDLLDHLRHHTPKGANPMAAMRTALSMLSAYDDEADVMEPEANYRKAVRLTAKLPTLVAAFDRIRKGKDVIAPTGEGSTAHDFLYQLNGEAPGPAAEEIMDAALVLHAEHGLNASTFTARVIGSTLADMYSAVVGAVGALKGPLHGGANIEVMKTLLELDESGETAQEFVDRKIENKEKIMGIGHRVYKTLDPRATILRNLLSGLSEEKGDTRWLEMSDTIRSTVKERKGLDANVDFYSASVYYLLGIEADLYTPIFAMSRMTGWTAHLLEQWQDNRLIRPRAEYVGARGKTVTPVGDRG
ncbi:citrate/2-methylcitrate synthase [Rubrivirga sp. S365]|uniref:Citrate synthase n=1 Tax=Rubrivirga litoralis TaxID=3075598 RepID=A0ABU3BPT9_9BACT|nr:MULTISPECIES: citrate/2-methylcitrate synthase [unclassified Rubrivirga]MDT0631301.1 citrate/2-methylcitrate synthase [Rubrivirga sp. F394]MDT7855995.1 citrate/2-methylcitrate synthase [Rubrivirga sp. S365]